MFVEFLDLFISYVQYLALIIGLARLQVPKLWTDANDEGFSFTTFGSQLFTQFTESFGLDDFRVYFVLLSVVAPLLIVILGLLTQNAPRVVLWYLMLVAGICCVVGGILTAPFVGLNFVEVDFDTSISIISIGGGMSLFCLLVGVTQWLLNSSRKEVTIDVTLAQSKHLNLTDTIESLILFVICGLPGFLLVTKLSLGPTDSVVKGLGNAALPVGLTLLILAGVALVWFLFSLFESGRALLWHVTSWIKRKVMELFLFVISLAFVPMVSTALMMFNCNEMRCAPNSRLPLFGDSIESVQGVCLTCTPGPTSSMCLSSVTDRRLEIIPGISCDEFRRFYWPAAGMALTSIVLILPLMFFRIISSSATLVKTEISPANEEATDEEQWQSQLGKSRNTAKNLYALLKFRFRHWSIIELVRRLFITVLCVFVVRTEFEVNTQIPICIVLGVHVIYTAVFVVTSPFHTSLHNRMNYVLLFLTLSSTIVAVLSVFEIDIPYAVYLAVFIVLVAVPVLAFIVGIMYLCHQYQRQLEEEDRTQTQRLQDIQSSLHDELERSQASPTSPRGVEVVTALPRTDSDSASIRNHTNSNHHTVSQANMKKNSFCVVLPPKPPKLDDVTEFTIDDADDGVTSSHHASPLMQGSMHRQSSASFHEFSTQKGATKELSKSQRGGDDKLHSSMRLTRSQSLFAAEEPPTQKQPSGGGGTTGLNSSLRRGASVIALEMSGTAGADPSSPRGARWGRLSIKNVAAHTAALQAAEGETDLPTDEVEWNVPAPRRGKVSIRDVVENPLMRSRRRQQAGNNNAASPVPPSLTPPLATFNAPLSPGIGEPPGSAMGSVMGSSIRADSVRLGEDRVKRRTKSINDVLGGSLTAEAAALRELKGLREDEARGVATVDHQIDNSVRGIFSSHLMFVGVVLVVALGFALLGFFNPLPEVQSSDNRAAVSLARGLLGYSSFSHLAQNCECSYSMIPLSRAMVRSSSFVTFANGTDVNGLAAVETWSCRNGAVKQRTRAMRRLLSDRITLEEVSSTAIRALCNATFASGCSLQVNATHVELMCTNGASADEMALW